MTTPKTIAEMTTELVTAFLNNNQIDPEELPKVIRGVHAVMKDVVWDAGHEPEYKSAKPIAHHAEPEILAPSWQRSIRTSQKPAVPIEESVTPNGEWLICLEDGKRFKTLRHHLRTAFNMSPEDYKKKWGLPADYPMTAPNYSQRRKEIADSIRLGKTIRSS